MRLPILILVYWLSTSFSHAQIRDFRAGINFEKGRMALIEGNYEEAVQAFSKAISLLPDFAAAYTGRGEARISLEQYEAGIDDCSKAIQLNPEDWISYYNRGSAYLYLFRFQKALEDFNDAIRLNPDFEMSYNSRGVTYLYSLQPHQAVQDFGRALQMNPDVPMFYYNRGKAKIGLKQYQSALTDLKKALELDSAYHAAYAYQGLAYAHLGQNKAALQIYEMGWNILQKAIKEAAESKGKIYDIGELLTAFMYKYKAEIQYVLGHPLRALEDLTIAINSLTGDYRSFVDMAELIHAYQLRGDIHMKLGNYQKAFSDYDMAIKFHPNPQASHYEDRARANGQLNKRQAAIEDYGRVLEQDPENLEAQAYLLEKLDKSASPQSVNGSTGTHIVSVGIASYEYPSILSSLNYPVEQVRDFERHVEELRFVEDAVVLTNANANLNTIKKTLESNFCDPDRVKPEDLVIFYFSGHGVAAGNQIGICPYDYFDQGQLLAEQDILEILKKSPARHKVVIIEACKSKIKDMGATEMLTDDQVDIFNAFRQNISDGIVFITSTEPGKSSLELTNFGGIFSQFFLLGIKGAADTNADQIISSRELFDYLKREVSQKSKGLQIPQINSKGYLLDIPIFLVR